MSKVETAMNTLISAFNKYSGKEGDKYSLSKVELKELLQNEMPVLMGNANKEDLDHIFKDLDMNKDNTVDFREFIGFVSTIAVLCHDFFKDQK